MTIGSQAANGQPRIVIVGAGGWVFPLELCRDILAHEGLAASRIMLYDIEPSAAKRTLGYVEELIGLAGTPTTVEVADHLDEALQGAHFVLTVFQVGGVAAYGHDILIPREYGIDQTVGDTLGPGGIFRGLRTVEALTTVAEAMLRICPDALLLNYANPMSINCWAIDRLGVRIVGLCHSVQGTSELLAHELGVPYDEVTFDCAGVNHTAWFTTFRRGDEDLIPKIREVMSARYLPGEDGQPAPNRPEWADPDDVYFSSERVRTELMELTGYFHTESSHHASEYWAWFRKNPEVAASYLDRRWDYYEICTSHDTGESNDQIVDQAKRVGIRTGGESAAPIMDSMVTGESRVVYANVRNDGLVSNLADDACVEVACRVDRDGVQPIPYGALPLACAALNNVQINVQRLTVEAAMTGDRSLVHAAVALDPLSGALLTLPQIHDMTERMLEAEREWLPASLE
jgi:alpha-galactosidase